MKKRYIIFHSFTSVWFLIVVFWINQILGMVKWNNASILGTTIFLYGLISTFTSIFIFFPLDIFFLSKIRKPFPKVKRNWIYSIIAYLITFWLADLHMGIITPEKKDSFDFLLDNVFYHFDSVFSIYVIYLIFFLVILLGIDILLRYLANKYFWQENK